VGTSAPDLITPVIGFRQWRLRGDELWSFQTDEQWGHGVHTAQCPLHAHHAPANGCSCGIYAWYSPTPRGASALTAALVGGAVALWGQIELHAHGMRAEHAVVVALALPFSWGAKRRHIRAAAAALEVPVVPARRLRATALRHGETIGRGMRPPDTTPNKRAAPGEPAPARLYAVADGYAELQRSREARRRSRHAGT
jgi:hypothetical protein